MILEVKIKHFYNFLHVFFSTIEMMYLLRLRSNTWIIYNMKGFTGYHFIWHCWKFYYCINYPLTTTSSRTCSTEDHWEGVPKNLVMIILFFLFYKFCLDFYSYVHKRGPWTQNYYKSPDGRQAPLLICNMFTPAYTQVHAGWPAFDLSPLFGPPSRGEPPEACPAWMDLLSLEVLQVR